ncbi:MAG: glycosyltransferase [Planctomycetota bacterium]
MRLLLTTSTFPVKQGDGIPRFILDLALALASYADVDVLAPDAPERPDDDSYDRINVHRFSYFWPRWAQRLAITNQRGMRENVRGSLLAKLQVPLFLMWQAIAVKRLVRRKKVDVVNAHWLVPQGLTAAWVLRRSPNVRLVLHIHAGDVYFLQRLSIGPRIARYVAKRADLIFAAGSHVRDALDDLLGFPSQAVIQPMGVDSKEFARGNVSEASTRNVFADRFEHGFILFIGRLVEKKGVPYLIQAMVEIRKQRPGVGLVIAGFGPEEPRLKAEVERLGLSDCVCFAGKQNRGEIIDLLHSCRAVAVPSIIDSRGETEGMPTVVVESLAAGVPVVGSAVNGIPDLIRHRENGWLCREKDSRDLAEKLLTALDSDCDELIADAIGTAQSNDWERVASNYVDHISRIGSLQVVEDKSENAQQTFESRA